MKMKKIEKRAKKSEQKNGYRLVNIFCALKKPFFFGKIIFRDLDVRHFLKKINSLKIS